MSKTIVLGHDMSNWDKIFSKKILAQTPCAFIIDLMEKTKFDPMKPTEQDLAFLTEGYTDATALRTPRKQGGAYGHGYQIGLNDQMSITQFWQIDLIKKLRAIGRL